MNSFDALKNDFETSWKSIGVYHGKGIINNILNWEDIINILNNAAKDKNPKINQYIKSSSTFEVVYKDMVAIKTVEYHDEDINNFDIVSDATFFFSLFFNEKSIPEKISKDLNDEINVMNNAFKIKTDFTSLKISLAEKFVPFEYHEWYTCIIQLQGTTYWDIKDPSTGLEELFILEPGDLFLFKDGIHHQLTNSSPRSSLVGRFVFNENGEKNA